jgi:hypothetical protein
MAKYNRQWRPLPLGPLPDSRDREPVTREVNECLCLKGDDCKAFYACEHRNENMPHWFGPCNRVVTITV